MGTLANSEDPDEMLHNAAFHQGLHCLLRQKPIFQRKKYNFFLFEIITCDPSIYTMDHPGEIHWFKRVKFCYTCCLEVT